MEGTKVTTREEFKQLFGYSPNKKRDFFIFDHGLRVRNQCSLPSELMFFLSRLLLPPALTPT